MRSARLGSAGTTALVTGATSGIGAAIARRFVAEGVRVVAAGRRPERLEALKSELGDLLHPVELDVRELAAVEATLDQLPEAFRDVGVVVANAGVALGREPADVADMADWRAMIDTNVVGFVNTVRASLPRLVQRGGGHVIAIGSVAGDYPYPGGNVYGATKAFVKQFCLATRADMLGKNVRVTNIEPGMTETEFSVVRFKGDEDRAKSVYAGMRPLAGEDVAEAVFWVASLPPHVNVNRLQVMPIDQAFSPFTIHRTGGA